MDDKTTYHVAAMLQQRFENLTDLQAYAIAGAMQLAIVSDSFAAEFGRKAVEALHSAATEIANAK